MQCCELKLQKGGVYLQPVSRVIFLSKLSLVKQVVGSLLAYIVWRIIHLLHAMLHFGKPLPFFFLPILVLSAGISSSIFTLSLFMFCYNDQTLCSWAYKTVSLNVLLFSSNWWFPTLGACSAPPWKYLCGYLCLLLCKVWAPLRLFVYIRCVTVSSTHSITET